MSNKLEDYINNIKEKSTIKTDEPIFIDFNNYAIKLGLEIVFSTFETKEDSFTAINIDGKSCRTSNIYIYLKTQENYIDNKINSHDSNWNADYKYTNDLISKWKDLVDKYSYPSQYKTAPMIVFINSLEKIAITKLVYICKDDIIKWMNIEKFKPKPEYLFCSSNPAYNIIFKNKKDFDNSNKSIELLKEQIHQILFDNDNLNYYEKGKVAINIYHKEMEGISIYGFARED